MSVAPTQRTSGPHVVDPRMLTESEYELLASVVQSLRRMARTEARDGALDLVGAAERAGPAAAHVELDRLAPHQALTPLLAASEDVREEGELATAYDVEALARLLFSRERRMRRR